jgi:hypothetical protein
MAEIGGIPYETNAIKMSGSGPWQDSCRGSAMTMTTRVDSVRSRRYRQPVCTAGGLQLNQKK